MTAESAAKTRKRATTPEPSAQTVAPVGIGALDQSIGYALRRAQLAVFADIIRTLGRYDLRPAQFSVLLVIGENPGLTQMQVGDALGIQRTNFVALFNDLERRGLARRDRGGDRRSYALYVTDEGAALLRRAQRAQAAHERRVTALIGDEARAQLLATLKKLAEPHDRP